MKNVISAFILGVSLLILNVSAGEPPCTLERAAQVALEEVDGTDLHGGGYEGAFFQSVEGAIVNGIELYEKKNPYIFAYTALATSPETHETTKFFGFQKVSLECELLPKEAGAGTNIVKGKN